MEQNVNAGWEQRLAEWDESDIGVDIYWSKMPGEPTLTEEEMKRVGPKVTMVERAAAKLMLNMIKGTIKYNTDSRSAEKWMDFAIDDATDTLNYLHLMKDRMSVDAVQLQLPLDNEYMGARA